MAALIHVKPDCLGLITLPRDPPSVGTRLGEEVEKASLVRSPRQRLGANYTDDSG